VPRSQTVDTVADADVSEPDLQALTG